MGAELMSKRGINVPKGVAVGSADDVKKAMRDMFSNQSEVVVKSHILAGGRGLGTFKSGLQGGVHIVKDEQVEEIAGDPKNIGKNAGKAKRGEISACYGTLGVAVRLLHRHLSRKFHVTCCSTFVLLVFLLFILFVGYENFQNVVTIIFEC